MRDRMVCVVDDTVVYLQSRLGMSVMEGRAVAVNVCAAVAVRCGGKSTTVPVVSGCSSGGGGYAAAVAVFGCYESV